MRSTSTGDYLSWDFISQAGCPEKGTTRSKGKNDMVGSDGIRYSILTHLARIGGKRYSRRRIKHEEIVGYIQALRGSASGVEKAKKQTPPEMDAPTRVPKKNPDGVIIMEWMIHRRRKIKCRNGWPASMDRGGITPPGRSG